MKSNTILHFLRVILILSFSSPHYAQEDIPRNVLGRPDFAGYWENLHQIAEQRPERFGERRAYTDEEVSEILLGMEQNQQARDATLEADRAPPQVGAVTVSYTHLTLPTKA